jgi:hypothetical protein
VHRWEISILPVLLGEGVPLFAKGTQDGLKGLRRTHSRILRNGIVEMRYEPDRSGS